jgi:hypothetical protein
MVILLVAIGVIPFVVTTTRLGLNLPDGGRADTPQVEEIRKRRTKLRAVLPVWDYVWWGTLLVCGLNWIVFYLGAHTNPLLALAGTVLVLSGFWFLLVHEVATSLFGK